MKYGFVRAAAFGPKLRVADTEYNRGQIIEAVKAAKNGGADVLVLPELCITGYTCGDLFGQDVLLTAAEESLIAIAKETAGLDMIVCLGVPVRCGQKLYNSAAVLYNGEILGIVPKTNIPNYKELYEMRDFTPAPKGNSVVRIAGKEVPFGTKLLFSCMEKPAFTIGVEICEDLWVSVPPSSGLAAAGATLILNPSASGEVIGKADYRRLLIASQSGRTISGYVYADASSYESSTDLVFSGHCLVAENGTFIAENELFSGDMVFADIDMEKLSGERLRINTFSASAEGYDTVYFSKPVVENPCFSRYISPYPFVPDDEKLRPSRCAEILELQARGLKKRLEHIGCSSVVLNISGGLDSTLALLVSAKTMDMLGRSRDSITALSLPCFGTTSRTKNNAESLCRALGVSFREINIKASVSSHFADIGQSDQVFDVTYENSQARERTQVAMDIANMLGGIVIGTGDLSELSLGWATYNGDHMSMYGVNASIPKTLIRHLVRYAADTAENAELRDTLLDILDTPVSPELLPAKDDSIAQKTEDIVGPYDLHDFFIFYFLRCGFGPKKIFFLAQKAFAGMFDDETIKKWLRTFMRRFFTQQFKRSCLPDGPKIGTVGVSPRGDWRMPSDASSAIWQKEANEL